MQCFSQQEADLCRSLHEHWPWTLRSLFHRHRMLALQSQNTSYVKTKHGNSTVFPRPLSGHRCVMSAVRDQSVVTLRETRCHADALTGQMPKLMDARPSVIRSSELNHYASLSRAGRSKTKTIDTGEEKWRTLSATSGQRRVVKVNRK